MLLSAWLQQLARDVRVAWLSLDVGNNDPACLMTCFIAALQTVESKFGQSALFALESPEVDITPGVLISLLNEIMESSDQLVLILDD
jgi:LuxR family maltose regulon positive regulatory protein